MLRRICEIADFMKSAIKICRFHEIGIFFTADFMNSVSHYYEHKLLQIMIDI